MIKFVLNLIGIVILTNVIMSCNNKKHIVKLDNVINQNKEKKRSYEIYNTAYGYELNEFKNNKGNKFIFNSKKELTDYYLMITDSTYSYAIHSLNNNIVYDGEPLIGTRIYNVNKSNFDLLILFSNLYIKLDTFKITTKKGTYIFSPDKYSIYDSLSFVNYHFLTTNHEDSTYTCKIEYIYYDINNRKIIVNCSLSSENIYSEEKRFLKLTVLSKQILSCVK